MLGAPYNQPGLFPVYSQEPLRQGTQPAVSLAPISSTPALLRPGEITCERESELLGTAISICPLPLFADRTLRGHKGLRLCHVQLTALVTSTSKDGRTRAAAVLARSRMTV
jgi:hypothetical protein